MESVTAKPQALTPFRACEIAEGFGDREYTQEEQIEAWQYLHTSGLAYSLQGWYGRTAQSLIEQGIIEA